MSKRVLLIALVAVLLLADGALIYLALTASDRAASTEAGATPAPSVPTVSASPSPSAPAPTTATPRPGTIALSAVDSLVAWRSDIGECGAEPATVAITDDGGATWFEQELAYDIRQVLRIDATSVDTATAVVARGDSCEIDVMTSFSAGRFWQSEPSELEFADVVNPLDPASLRIDGATVEAPCEPQQLAASGDVEAVRCADGSVQLNTDGEWSSTEAEGVIAISTEAGDTVDALTTSESCAVGLASIATATGEVTERGCLDVPDALLENLDEAPLALDVADDAVWLATPEAALPLALP